MSARVLVVDDVMPNVKLLAAKLTREYFDVITAYNGQQALELVKKESPDIVLLDVMMPGMDGFEVCQRIRSDPATMHIPVVMVTALSDISDRVRGLEAGADDFLTKPVNDIALFARVRSLVRLKMMMDEWRLRESTSGHFGMLNNGGSLLSESTEEARVLVLEDSPLDLDKITETLKRDGSVVYSAATGADALERALTKDFELVIVSLTLLNEDGLRLCSQLRSHERTRQVPILLMIDEGDMNRVAKGLELGANDYVIKPIDRNELQARVRTQIRRKRYQDRLRANYEQSLSLALTDSLTGVFNRRYVSAHLPRLLDRAADSNKPVSILMFDIDHFKRVNDTFGHDIGDEVLKEVAERAARNLRNFDLVARLGGEEFVVIMPDTDGESALMVAERLRNRIGDTVFKISAPVGEIVVTVSVGVAVGGRIGDTVETLIKRSDEALYEAKRSGRNRVVADKRDIPLSVLQSLQQQQAAIPRVPEGAASGSD
jgi:two-component system cell cycle response regulator